MANNEVTQTSTIQSYQKVISRKSLKLGLVEECSIKIVAEKNINSEDLNGFYQPTIALLSRILVESKAEYRDGKEVEPL